MSTALSRFDTSEMSYILHYIITDTEKNNKSNKIVYLFNILHHNGACQASEIPPLRGNTWEGALQIFIISFLFTFCKRFLVEILPLALFITKYLL